MVQDVFTGWYKALFEAGGAHEDGGVDDGVCFAGLGHEEVVRHHISVGEGELDLLAGLHVKFLHVKHEALADGANADRGQFRRVAEDAGLLGLFLGFSGDDATFGARFNVEPEVLDDIGSVAGVQFGGFLHGGEQRGVAHIMLLVNPEGFEQMVSVFFLRGVKLLNPFLRGGDDFGGGAFAELDAGAMTHAIGGMLEVFEQRGDGLTVDGDGFLQFAAFGGHAVDAAVFVVAIWVAYVVLHVADDDVVPVGDVERAIFAEDGIAGAEILVAAHEQAAGFVLGDSAVGLRDLHGEFRTGRFAPDAGFFRVTGQVVVLDAEEADDVADEEVALHVLGEVRAADDFARGDGAHFLLEQLIHFEAVAFGAHLVSATAGAVGGVLIAPGVKSDAVGVGRVVSVLRNGETARIEAIHGTRAGLQRRTPRMLVIVHHEDTALPVDAAIGAVDEIVRAVMRVGEIDALQHDRAHIGHVVAIGVFEEDDVRGAGDDDAAIPELKAERILHAGELRHAVALAVLVVVVADDERVLHLLQWLPHRVGVPHGGPQAAFGIDLHLHGIHELRELRLIGEQAHFKARIKGHVLDRFLAADVFRAAFLHRAR